MKSKITNFIENIYKYTITGIIFPLIILFSAVSILYSCMLNMDVILIRYYVADNALINILAIMFVLILGVFLEKNRHFQSFSKRLEEDSAYFLKCRRACLAIIAVIASFWVLSTQYMPQYDQKSIMDAVYSLHIQDNKIFSNGQYISSAPHQLGLVWFYYGLTFIFGAQNYIALQLINVVALVVFWKELSDLCGFFNFSRLNQLLVVVMGILFYPLTMYCSFIYGNLLGLAFSVLAVRLEFRFFKTNKIRYATASATAIALAVAMKSNYVIFMIGMVIYAVIKLITNKKPIYFFIMFITAVTYVVQAKLPVALTQAHTDGSLGESISSLAYIAMSVEYNDTEDGWYTGYNWNSFKEAGYDTEVQAEMAKTLIFDSLDFYKENPDLFKVFFTKKTVSQWCNPDFQCYWIFQNTDNITSPGNIAYKISEFSNIYTGVKYLNVLQSIIYAGAALYFIYSRNKENFTDSLILPMIIIGGLVFHTFWEAKSLYVLSYFVLLIPYSVAGYTSAANWLALVLNREIKPDLSAVLKTPFMWVTIVTIAFFAWTYSGDKGRFLAEDTAEFHSYISHENRRLSIRDGSYTLSTASGYVLSQGMQDGYYVPVAYLSDTLDENCKIQLTNYQKDTWLRFTASNTLLSYTEDGDPRQQTVLAIESELRDSQKWTVEDTGGGMVYIRYQKNYLTYDEETMEVYTAPYSGMANQIWNVNKL